MRATIAFTAEVVAGEGRGRTLGSPTMNLDLADVPKELREGVYAVRVNLACRQAGGHAAVMHYGPRPTMGLHRSCEIHILMEEQESGAASLGRAVENGKWKVEVVKRLRDVREFENEGALKEQIAKDIEQAWALLQSAP